MERRECQYRPGTDQSTPDLAQSGRARVDLGEGCSGAVRRCRLGLDEGSKKISVLPKIVIVRPIPTFIEVQRATLREVGWGGDVLASGWGERAWETPGVVSGEVVVCTR